MRLFIRTKTRVIFTPVITAKSQMKQEINSTIYDTYLMIYLLTTANNYFFIKNIIMPLTHNTYNGRYVYTVLLNTFPCKCEE